MSASSPTDELLTLGRILSEVGGYASTILDREHLSLSRRCGKRLGEVVDELISRKSIQSEDNLHDVPPTAPSAADLSVLTIDELDGLYRSWPIRRKARESDGREQFTFYPEGRIVRELQRRKAADRGEQLKIDYCIATYRNELDNMSFVFSRPITTGDDRIVPDSTREYTAAELTALIGLYSGYRDIMEREMLVEYVDYALDQLEWETDAVSCLGLVTELVELRRRNTIRVPEWVDKRLEAAVNDCISLKDCTSGIVNCTLAEAMLTLQLVNGDNTLTGKARRIINRCYRSAFEESVDIGGRIENLHTAVTCCDYVTRFSVRKAAALWNELSDKALSSVAGLSPRHTFLMLEVSKELEDYAHISVELKNRLKRQLDKMSVSGSPETMAYKRFVELKF